MTLFQYNAGVRRVVVLDVERVTLRDRDMDNIAISVG
jgi:hypothetical protein